MMEMKSEVFIEPLELTTSRMFRPRRLGGRMFKKGKPCFFLELPMFLDLGSGDAVA